jgi:hypothetical protein
MRFVFVLLLLFGSIVPQAFAQEGGSPAATLQAPVKHQIDYTLAYPGILPNNPLYPIKMARDRIVLFLIADRVKRAEFNLLQADKRVAAGALLIKEDKKHEVLAITTVEKGENYFHDAMNQAFQLKQEGRDVAGLIRDLGRALEKHVQVLTDLKKDLSKTGAVKVDHVLGRLATYQKIIKTSY